MREVQVRGNRASRPISGLSASVRRGLWILGLLLAAPLLGACTQEDIDWIVAEGRAWARANDLIDDQGNPNYIGVAIWYASPSTDPAARAALDAGRVVKGIQDADQLAQDGARSGNLDLIEQAIDRRPEDWSYQEQKAALLLAQEDAAGAEAAFNQATDMVQERIAGGGDCRSLARNLLTHRQAALHTQMQMRPNAALQDKLDETNLELNLLAEGQPTLLCP